MSALVFDRGDDHGHSSSVHSGGPFQFDGFTQLFDEGVENIHGSFALKPLTSAEEHGKLDFVALFEKRPCSIQFYLAIVRVRLGSIPDFF